MIELICLQRVKYFQALEFLIISSRLRLATRRSVSLSILSILYVLCRGFVGCWALDCLVIGDFAVEDILNEYIFECTSWSFLIHFGVHLYFRSLTNEELWFLFSCLGLGRQVLSLSLMLFGGRIGDLCNGCFDRDFVFSGVRVGVIDPTCVFVGTTTLDLSPFATCCWAGAW